MMRWQRARYGNGMSVREDHTVPILYKYCTGSVLQCQPCRDAVSKK